MANGLAIEVYNAQGEQQPIGFASDIPDLSALPSGQYTICFYGENDIFVSGLKKD